MQQEAQGRKQKIVKISEPGRDFGKSFLITEWPAMRAEKWAIRVFIALARGGVEVPDDIKDLGMAGVAMVGMKMLAGLDPDDAEPLLDQMWECVQHLPDGSESSAVKLNLGGSETVQEVGTLLTLRSEIVEIHTGFSVAGRLSKGTNQPALDTTSQDSSITPTSQSSSAQSSRRATRG